MISLLSALLVVLSLPAYGQEVPLPSRVLLRTLDVVEAHPVEIHKETITAHGSGGNSTQTFARDTVIGLIVGPRSSREADSRWRDVLAQSGERAFRAYPELRLVDGQVFPGSLRLTATPPTWTHPRLGSIGIDLETVESIRLVDGVKLPVVTTHDSVVLRNGDRVDGFVLGLADPLEVEQETNGTTKVLSIPLQRVAAIALVNERVPPAGIRVWTSDGSIIDVEDVRVGEDGYVRLLQPAINPSREVEFRRAHLRGISFDTRRLRPLASIMATLDTDAAQAQGIRSWAPPVVVGKGFWPLDAATLSLRGPARVRWNLPHKGCVVAMTAEVPIDSIHGDYDLVVRDGAREVQRYHLNHASPRARIQVALTSADLELELTTGKSGPVHDDVVLHEGVVLVPQGVEP